MSERRLQLDVITPEGVVYTGLVKMVVAKGAEGELGILPLHAPLITFLTPGELAVKLDDDKWLSMVVDKGFFEVRNDKVIVLVDAAEITENIDLEQIALKRDGALEKLKEARESGKNVAEAEEELNKIEAWLTTARSRAGSK